jgi:hypothetical protein
MMNHYSCITPLNTILTFLYLLLSIPSGPINTWDRQPYQWRTWNTSDVTPLPIVITRNFVINNYNRYVEL